MPNGAKALGATSGEEKSQGEGREGRGCSKTRLDENTGCGAPQSFSTRKRKTSGPKRVTRRVLMDRVEEDSRVTISQRTAVMEKRKGTTDE